MKQGFYLSDVSVSWFKRMANRENKSVGSYIDAHYFEWVGRRVVIKDSGLIELIEYRKNDNPWAKSIVERGDKPLPKFKSPAVYDGVVWLAMFGKWERRKHEFTVSDDAIEALASWVVSEEIVRRRAASVNTLASQALELVGRGWTEPRVSDARSA